MSEAGIDRMQRDLEAKRDDLLAGGAEKTLEYWVRTKRNEAAAVAVRPHPHEFTMYYDL